MAGLWDECRRIVNEKHLNNIDKALTNLRGHYHKIPVKYVKEGDVDD
jgi:hypothetical protein